MIAPANLEQFSISSAAEEIRRQRSLHLGYIGNLGRHLTAGPNLNQNGYGGGPLPDPALDGVHPPSTGKCCRSNDHAMHTMFQRPLSGGLAVPGNHTYSHSTGKTQVTYEGQGGATTTCVGHRLVENPIRPGPSQHREGLGKARIMQIRIRTFATG